MAQFPNIGGVPIVGGGGGSSAPKSYSPPSYINQRAGSIPSPLAGFHPQASMALIASPLMNSELSPAALAVLRTLPAWQAIPQDALQRVMDIDPKYQPLALWLIAQQRVAGGAGFAEAPLPSQNRQLPAHYDPKGLSDLVISAAPGQFTLRSTVADFLRIGGLMGGYAGTPIGGNKLSSVLQSAYGADIGLRPARTEVTGPARPEALVPANPEDPNFQRAAILTGIIHYLFPNATSAFQSGGVIGQLQHLDTQSINAITAPAGYLWRVSQQGKYDVTPNFRNMWTNHVRSAGLQIGDDFARGAGYEPGNPGYTAAVGVTNFIAQWYLDPAIVTGKVSAGFRLARDIPRGEDIFQTYKALQGKPWLTQVAYLSRAKSIPDLVFKTAAGTGRINEGWNIINRFGGSGSGEAEAALHQYWGPNLPEGATTYLARATSKEDLGWRLAATFAPEAAADTEQIARNIDRLKNERTLVDTALRDGTADINTIDRQMYLTKAIDQESKRLTQPQDPTIYTGEPMLALPAASTAKRFTSYLDGIARSEGQDSVVAKALVPLFYPVAKGLRGPLERHALAPAEAIGAPQSLLPRFNMGAWFNQITDRHVDNWMVAGKEGSREQGVRNLNTFLADRGLNAAERRMLVAKFLAAKDPGEWAGLMLKEVPGAIKASRLPEWAKTQDLHFFDTLRAENFGVYRTKAYTDAIGIERWTPVPAWIDETGMPIPMHVSELLDGVTLPGHEGWWDTGGLGEENYHPGVLDSTSFFRAKVLPAFGRKGNGWRKWQLAQNNITTTWRDGILLLRSPSVLIRTQLEQAARLPLGSDVASVLSNPLRWMNYAIKGDRTFAPHLEPGWILPPAPFVSTFETAIPKVRVWSGDISAADAFLAGDRASLGQLADNLFYGSRQAGDRAIYTLDAPAKSADRAGAIARKQMQIVHAASNADVQFLATHTPEELIDWYKSTAVGKVYLKQLRPFIERGNVAGTFDEKLQAFATAKKHWLETQVVGGLDVMRNLVSSGRFTMYRRGIPQRLGETGGFIEHTLPDVAANMQGIFDEAGRLRTDAETMTDATAREHMLAEADVMEEDLLRELRGLPRGRAFTTREWQKAITNGDMGFIRANAPGWLAQQGVVDIRSGEFRDVVAQMAYDDQGQFTRDVWNVDPEVGGKAWGEWAGGVTQRKFRNAWYRKMLGTPDFVLSRAPMYRQLFDRYVAEFRSRGLSVEASQRAAANYAKVQTKEGLYDLGTRTSAQFHFRHVAPFMPAYQEILKTWMWNIPMNKGGPLIGHAYLASRANAIISGLKALGIDVNHPLFLPFLGSALGRGAQGSFNPLSLNLVLGPSGFSLPGLGPTATVENFLTGRVFKQARPVTDWLAQNYDARLWPSNLAHIWYGITGNPSRLDYLSSDVQDRMYAEAKDKAMRHAYVELSKAGTKAPNLEASKYAGTDGFTKYQADAQTYMDAVTARANSDLKHWELMRGIVSTFWPAPVSQSDAYSRSLDKLYAELATVAKGSPQAQALYDAWLADHPDGELYLEPTTDLKANAPPGTPTHPDINGFFQQLADGIRVVRTPEDFLAIGMGLISKTQYQHRLESNLNALSSTPGQPASAADLLRNWHDRSSDLANYRAGWERYLAYNPTFNSWWTAQHPTDPGALQEKLYHAADALSQLEPFFTTNGVRSGDYRAIKGQIGAGLSELLSQAPKGSTLYAQADGINWWFDHVFTPVSDKLDALYTKARVAGVNSDYTSRDQAFNDIRALLSQQKEQTRDGVTYPTFEEWQWGAKAEGMGTDGKVHHEQDVARAQWSMEKPQWLTDFQRGKVGYPSGADAEAFASAVGTYDSQYYAKRAYVTETVHTGQVAALQALEDQRNRELSAAAARFGSGAQRLWALMQMTPGQRLAQGGNLEGAAFLIAQAQTVSDKLTHDGLSPTGDSAEALALKGPLYTNAMQLYQTNKNFRIDVDFVRRAQSSDPTKIDVPWTTLWAELFFGQFPINLNPKTPTTTSRLGGGGTKAPAFPPIFGGIPVAP